MDIEPVTAQAPRPVRRALLAQQWRDVTFLHWPVPAERVASLLPAGTRPDTFGGTSYVGLVAFRMVDTGLGAGPAVPYLGTFCETNVRVYSVDDAGRRGVVFLSMDAERLPAVLIGRAALGLPYRWSAMALRRDGDVYRYRCRRRLPRGSGPMSRLAVRVGEEDVAAPTALEHFLTARWGLHTRAHGRTRYLPTVHPPWPLRRAQLLELADDLVASSGLPADGPPVSVLFSPGVPARFGPLGAAA